MAGIGVEGLREGEEALRDLALPLHPSMESITVLPGFTLGTCANGMGNVPATWYQGDDLEGSTVNRAGTHSRGLSVTIT